ncbi:MULTISPECIES: TonB-dependent receptor [unclassified Janthinobacterium]|uniref:TonB-dependent receptor n=1 Tax=unclassified Janthinobacterium TaxID=2610881 RepID=UPI00160A07B0|nr:MULTISPECIES: TonB-dependent receptor [unclassified Janthinobacterium]MBB5610930.1 iron complex outermembrane receptor protein [Janthinobacterium sp. S3T4]MBB5616416.1 iron complex outermembrane receptor protein [Janthinobacterium sp. S3M3]
MQHRFHAVSFKPALSRQAAAVRAVVLGLALSAAGVPALAQSQASGLAAEAKSNFNVAAGPLGSVLNSFATTAGIELTADTSLLQGKSSKGLSGSYSVREGFTELLRGHSLHAIQQANGSYTVSRLAQQGEVVMPGVTVQAQQGGATQAYAGGHVASGGRVGLLGSKDFMETPFNTVSYTERFIEDRQARDITDVISAVDPTVFSTGMTGTINENYSIRGFSSSISDVTVNGLFGISPYYRTSPEMFERIEVLKGPSALLNGMPPGGSVGGSVNLVPKRAGDEPLTRAALSYLSDSQWGGHVDLGRRFGEQKQFGARFNGVYRKGNGSVDHQKKETQLAALGLDWRGDGARLSADLYRSDDRTDGLNRGINLAPGLGVPRLPKPDTLLNPSWAFYDTKDKGATVRGELDLSESVMAYVAMGASQTDYHSTGAYLIQVFNTAGDYRTNLADLAFEVDRKSAELGFKGKLRTGDIGHQWAVNATHYNHSDKQYGRRNVLAKDWITNLYNPVWGPASTFNAPQISRAELRLSSVGLADTLSFAQDTVQWTLGLRRQDVVSDTFNVATGARTARYEQSATSPATALLVKLTPQWSVYGNYIEGLSQGSTAPMTAANAGEVFPPFKTKQKEVGLKFDLGEFAHTASLYEIKRPSSYTDPVTNVFSVGGEQRNRGVEWSFFGSPIRTVRLMGGLAFVEPKLTQTAGGVNQGKLATGVPKLQAKLGAEWDTPSVPGLSLTANATAASKQYINAGNTLWVPGRTVFDLGGRYATVVANQPMTLRANVTNVSNKAYWAMPQLTSLGLGAPRTIQISATMDF